jgi:uncharacterized membrane protein YeiH
VSVQAVGALLDVGANTYVVLEIVGTVAFAVSGAMAAVRARMDWLGVLVLAIVVAIGGGTVRDLLLGRVPVFWVAEPWPVVVAAVTAVVVIGLATRYPQSKPDSWTVVVVADAAGLAVFTVAGTLIAAAGGASPPVAVLLGVVTGTGGGVLRDVLVGRRPLVLVGEVYALAAVAGATLFLLLVEASGDPGVARWVAVAVVLAVRLLALRRGWSLPSFAERVPS